MAGRNRPKRAKVRGKPTKALFKRKILNGGFRLDVATTPSSCLNGHQTASDPWIAI